MGKLFIGTEEDREILRKIHSWWKNLRGTGISNTPEGPSFNIPTISDLHRVDTRAIRMQIVSIENDTVTCKYYDGTTATGEDILVAKAPENRHDTAALYPNISSMATIDAQTVSVVVTDGGATEIWKLTPDLIAGGEIWAAFAPVGGVGIDDVTYIDDNRAARAWCHDPDASE